MTDRRAATVSTSIVGGFVLLTVLGVVFNFVGWLLLGVFGGLAVGMIVVFFWVGIYDLLRSEAKRHD